MYCHFTKKQRFVCFIYEARQVVRFLECLLWGESDTHSDSVSEIICFPFWKQLFKVKAGRLIAWKRVEHEAEQEDSFASILNLLRSNFRGRFEKENTKKLN